MFKILSCPKFDSFVYVIHKKKKKKKNRKLGLNNFRILASILLMLSLINIVTGVVTVTLIEWNYQCEMLANKTLLIIYRNVKEYCTYWGMIRLNHVMIYLAWFMFVGFKITSKPPLLSFVIWVDLMALTHLAYRSISIVFLIEYIRSPCPAM